MSNPNAIGWFDIYVDDLKRAKKFYEKVFEQDLVELKDPTGETQMYAFEGDRKAYGASGALVKSAYAKPGGGGSLIYFSVDDCALTEKKVNSAGGKIIRPKFSIGEFGFVTICEDTEGNKIGLNSMK